MKAVTELEMKLETSRFGIWIFLAMEMLFFGALFLLYTALRVMYPQAFALGSRHLQGWLGALNTAVLLSSSMTMAIAVKSAHARERRHGLIAISATAILALTFLALKAHEYQLDVHEGLFPGLRWQPTFAHPKELGLFFSLYVFATVIHAVHVLIGLSWMSTVAVGWSRTLNSELWISKVEALGLYWHFVDVVWVFLFPMLYLIGGLR